MALPSLNSVLCVMDIVDLGRCAIHMFGDLNARTGNKNPENEQVFNIFEDEDDIQCKSISVHPKTKK